jgi:hypothetical protein
MEETFAGRNFDQVKGESAGNIEQQIKVNTGSGTSPVKEN